MNAAPAMLLLFDLDGTLLAPEAGLAAERAYWAGLSQALGLPDGGPVWLDAVRHVTCRGVADAWCRLRHGRPIARGEVAALRRLYRDGLDRAALAPAARGAAGLLAQLAAEGRAWGVATGCFAATARLKIARAGLPLPPVLASCDDGVARATILRRAVARAEAHHRRRFARIVSIGDGPWDLAAAEALGLAFVGIARGERARVLARAGARRILPHFDPPAALLAAAARA